eukprot:SAG22_NODE_202_length_15324_cov_7.802627_9_plen_86_part_00
MRMQKFPDYKKVYVTLNTPLPFEIPLGLGRMPKPELGKRKMNQVSITDKFDYVGGGKKKGLGGRPGRAKSGKGKTGRPHRTNRNR